MDYLFWRVVAKGRKKAHLTIRSASGGSTNLALCDKPLDIIMRAEPFIKPDKELCKECLTLAGFTYQRKDRPAKSAEDLRVDIHNHLRKYILEEWSEGEKAEARRQLVDHLNKLFPRAHSN